MSPSKGNPLKHSQFSEYAILYSENLTQKSKIWHDGKCKFFKFNKKLIVYNDENTVISTHFVSNPRVLDQMEKEIKINDAILIIIEDKIGDYERDVSVLFNSKTNSDNVNTTIVNKRITPTTPGKENVVAQVPRIVNQRRVGLSKLSSPSYISKLSSTIASKDIQIRRTPLTAKLQDLSSISGTLEGRRRVTSLKSVPTSDNKSTIQPRLTPPAELFTLHKKRTAVDVYASDDDQDISEELSDIEVGQDEDIATQTRTYSFKNFVNNANRGLR